MSTIGSLTKDAITRLKVISDSPYLDVQVLLAEILNKSRSWVLSHPEFNLSLEQEEQFNLAVQRLENGDPLPYILGKWEFFGLELSLSPDTLIPRPETELLVERGLSWLNNLPGKRLAADIGTGSGCVAISLAYHCSDLICLATDISYPALKVARQNVARYQLSDRVFCLQCDLLPPIMGQFDLICANLPYIPTQRLKSLKVGYKEPTLALDGGYLGLELITRLLSQFSNFHLPVGLILLEIDPDQKDMVTRVATEVFPTRQVTCISDLAGNDRVIAIQPSGEPSQPIRVSREN